MALSREQKETAVADLTELLKSSKLTVVAQYTGVGVSDIQALRKQAKADDTVVRVAKNRLVKLALKQVEPLASTDTSELSGQLLYAFNANDEVAPAQALANFAKEHEELQFVGAISESGEFMDAEAVKRLANLPSKDQLRGQLVGTIAAPLTGLVGVMSGNLRSIVTVLNARKEQVEA